MPNPQLHKLIYIGRYRIETYFWDNIFWSYRAIITYESHKNEELPPINNKCKVAAAYHPTNSFQQLYTV